ncbi:MAG TPA: glycine cleavage system aminomethyltransferase GcvT [Gemmatimonadaceae bacterium]|nr:glycine cleavage system aminomethyltransferase GcvT [Gemmatimonadaceae bacterium]
MTQSAASINLRHTPLHDVHVAIGAKMVPFAGYEMPVQYPTGITAEHLAVREKAGLFDVSHMGEFDVRGPDAMAFVNYVTSNDVAALADNQAHYSTILNDQGTIVDDCLVYKLPERIMMVVNASNREKDFEHISRHSEKYDVALTDISDDIALLALQGPEAARILQKLTRTDLGSIGYYHFAVGQVDGMETIISRTGYTGEDGFELYFDPKFAAAMWNTLTATGEVTPAGLGARDTLRLEMGMALYGNDIDDTTTPLEANLAWLVKLKKGDFVGRAALEKQKAEGVPRKLVGFTTLERSFPRPGYPVYQDGKQVGLVRSGTMSPSLGIPIATCYVPRATSAEGTPIEVEIRGKRVSGKIVKLPFYTKGSHL